MERSPRIQVQNSVTVLVRVRKRAQREGERGTTIEVDEEGKLVFAYRGDLHKFSFWKVFNEETTQDALFSQFENELDLYGKKNKTIFAYGQTGSGKTYSMFGTHWVEEYEQFRNNSPEQIIQTVLNDQSNFGIIPRIGVKLFDENTKPITVVGISCSYFQIYNEKIYDLLNRETVLDLQIKNTRFEGPIIDGLVEVQLGDVVSCLDILKRGSLRRSKRETLMNKYSSRAHTIVQFIIETLENDQHYKTKLNLCDLAGNEKYRDLESVKRERLTEMKNINQSLSTLGKVVKLLSENKDDPSVHIPYRESKLTRVLQDSLGGSSQTFLIATLSPSIKYLEESFQTLKFAQRTSNVQVKVQDEMDAIVKGVDMINHLKNEIKYLKDMLQIKRQGNGISSYLYRIKELEKENNRLQRFKPDIEDYKKVINENKRIKMELSTLKDVKKDVSRSSQLFSMISENERRKIEEGGDHAFNDDTIELIMNRPGVHDSSITLENSKNSNNGHKSEANRSKPRVLKSNSEMTSPVGNFTRNSMFKSSKSTKRLPSIESKNTRLEIMNVKEEENPPRGVLRLVKKYDHAKKSTSSSFLSKTPIIVKNSSQVYLSKGSVQPQVRRNFSSFQSNPIDLSVIKKRNVSQSSNINMQINDSILKKTYANEQINKQVLQTRKELDFLHSIDRELEILRERRKKLGEIQESTKNELNTFRNNPLIVERNLPDISMTKKGLLQGLSKMKSKYQY